MQHIGYQPLNLALTQFRRAAGYLLRKSAYKSCRPECAAHRSVFQLISKFIFLTVIASVMLPHPAKSESAAVDPARGASDVPRAEYLLAMQYEYGEGEIKDYLRAASLFCSAARAGNRDALFELGWMYANGRGVPSDDHFARGLFELAARLGHQHASALLSFFSTATPSEVPPCLTPVAPSHESLPMERNASASRDLHNLSGDKIYRLVARLAPQYKIDPDLALAVIYAESGFNQNAVSAKNAQGLMQLIPETAKRFHVKNPFDPEQNIAGGLAYLRWLLNLFKGDVRLVTAAYNAGEGAIQHYRGIPPYPETRRYVEKITALYGHTFHPFGTAPSEKTSVKMKK